MAQVAAPTKARLASSLRVAPTNAAVQRILNRLSRSSLLSLALDWTEEGNAAMTRPLISPMAEEGDEDRYWDDFYPPAHSLKELRGIYLEIQSRKGSKREVVDRMLQGDWRHGLTLYQLAMADFQYLSDHPTSQRWMAHRIMPLKALDSSILDQDLAQVDHKSLAIPRVHPSTFLESLQKQVLPDAKAHFQFDQRRKGAFVLLRIFVFDSPYNTELALSSSDDGVVPDFDSSRTLYIAFPDGAPFIYISKAQTLGTPSGTDTRSLRNLVFAGVRRALSKPRERYTIISTTVTTRNLATLLHVRGPGRTNTAGGGWEVYTDDQQPDTPLDRELPRPPLLEVTTSDAPSNSGPNLAKRPRVWCSTEPAQSKRAKLVAKARFGGSGIVTDGKGVERVDVTVADPFPASEDAPAHHSNQPRSGDLESGMKGNEGESSSLSPVSHDDAWTPSVRLAFRGVHVFAGMRQLVQRGTVDGERMPGWLTGEENITVGAVRHGRIRGHRRKGP